MLPSWSIELEWLDIGEDGFVGLQKFFKGPLALLFLIFDLIFAKLGDLIWRLTGIKTFFTALLFES